MQTSNSWFHSNKRYIQTGSWIIHFFHIAVKAMSCSFHRPFNLFNLQEIRHKIPNERSTTQKHNLTNAQKHKSPNQRTISSGIQWSQESKIFLVTGIQGFLGMRTLLVIEIHHDSIPRTLNCRLGTPVTNTNSSLFGFQLLRNPFGKFIENQAFKRNSRRKLMQKNSNQIEWKHRIYKLCPLPLTSNVDTQRKPYSGNYIQNTKAEITALIPTDSINFRFWKMRNKTLKQNRNKNTK